MVPVAPPVLWPRPERARAAHRGKIARDLGHRFMVRVAGESQAPALRVLASGAGHRGTRRRVADRTRRRTDVTRGGGRARPAPPGGPRAGVVTEVSRHCSRSRAAASPRSRLGLARDRLTVSTRTRRWPRPRAMAAGESSEAGAQGPTRPRSPCYPGESGRHPRRRCADGEATVAAKIRIPRPPQGRKTARLWLASRRRSVVDGHVEAGVVGAVVQVLDVGT
jgi:hypothetical protein